MYLHFDFHNLEEKMFSAKTKLSTIQHSMMFHIINNENTRKRMKEKKISIGKLTEHF